jgi:hypothetical protein
MAAVVQHPAPTGTTSSAATVAQAFVSNVTAGNLIAVKVRISQVGLASGVTITCADSLGNTYSSAVIMPATGANDSKTQWFYAKNITGGACTVTASHATAQRQSIEIFEISGLDTTSPLETTNTATGTSTAPTGGSVTTAGGGFLLAGVQTDNNYSTITAGSGWTQITEVDHWSEAGSEYRITSAGGTYSGDFSNSNNDAYRGGIVAYKDAAGGGGSTTRGTPFGQRGTAFNGGRTFYGPMR